MLGWHPNLPYLRDSIHVVLLARGQVWPPIPQQIRTVTTTTLRTQQVGDRKLAQCRRHLDVGHQRLVAVSTLWWCAWMPTCSPLHGGTQRRTQQMPLQGNFQTLLWQCAQLPRLRCRDDTRASYSIRPARAQHLLGMHRSEIGLHVACRHRPKSSHRVEHVAVHVLSEIPWFLRVP